MLKWRGREVEEKLTAATRRGIDSTLAECVRVAKGKAPVVTAVYQGSIQMRPVTLQGFVMVGLWGSFACNYALILEIGSAPHDIYPRIKQALFWPGASHPVSMVHHPGTKGGNYLRSTADVVYPSLISRIRGGFV